MHAKDLLLCELLVREGYTLAPAHIQLVAQAFEIGRRWEIVSGEIAAETAARIAAAG